MLQPAVREVDGRCEGTSMETFLDNVNSSNKLDGWTRDEEMPDDVHEQTVEEWARGCRKIMELDPGVVRRKKEGDD
jgi:hypothetical protein